MKSRSVVRELAQLVEHRRNEVSTPFLVAIDGRSGVGKSTLAHELAGLLDATVINGDDFFAGGTAMRAEPASVLAGECIDWRRLRLVLEMLGSGQPAIFHPFDWTAFDGSLSPTPVTLAPRRILLVEGVYSARPELRDMIGLAILIRLDASERDRRLVAREGDIGPWERQWHRAEDWYFDERLRDLPFDAVVENGALSAAPR